MLSFPGAILPAWGYHLRPHYLTIGNYFLAIVAGVGAASGLLARGRGESGISGALNLACVYASCVFVLLSFTAPPVHEGWRIPCLFGLGVAAGLLNTSIFHAISPSFRMNPAGTVNLGGILFGLGSFLNPLLVAGTFRLYNVQAIT